MLRHELKIEAAEADLNEVVRSVLTGIDQAPGAIAGLYRGDNRGKRLIRLS